MFSAISEIDAASSRRSSSSRAERSSVDTTSVGLSRRSEGMKRSASAAPAYCASRSARKRSLIPGLRIFTATRPLVPLRCSVAWCTCAIEAAAIGGEMSVRSAARSSSACFSSTGTSAGSNGSILSCSCARSAATSSPTMSGRVASVCPIFT